MTTASVFPLTAPAASDLGNAGGKAVGLHALFELGLPVPEGFCVSAAAFRRVTADAGCLPLLKEGDALDPAGGATVRAYAARVRAAIEAMPLPSALADEVVGHWREGLGGAPVAVRSSATAEDLEDASFAGQQDTFLDVRDPEALLEAVRRCWASLFSDRAITYRLHRGIPSSAAAMGVVVQRLVPADVAGVLFTADPKTGHRGVITVEAVRGLGESLVSGRASPDSYRVSKRDGALLELRRGGDGERLLSPAALDALVVLGRRVEDGRGAPQDVEWAVADGRCWLLQARAITTLNPLPSPPEPDGQWRVFASFGHIQMNTAPLSPLALSLVRNLVPFLRDPETGLSRAVKEAGGRVYVDFTPMLASPKIGARFCNGIRSISPQLSERLEAARIRPELRSARSRAVSPRVLLRTLLPILGRAARNAVGSPARVVSQYTEALDAGVRSQYARVDREQGAARLVVLEAVVRGMFGALLFRLAAPFVVMMLVGERLLRAWTRRFAPQLSDDALLRALEGNIVTEMDLALGDLADLARPVSALREALTSDSPAPAVEALRELPDASAFFRGWDRFLEQFGDRGAGEIDVAVPRWRDNPSGPLRTIAALLGHAAGDHRAQQRGAREGADRAFAEVVEGARRGVFGWLRARFVSTVIRRLRVVLALREHHKHAFIQVLALARRECLAAGRRLVDRGVLDDPGDVWWLTLRELTEADVRSAAGEPVSGIGERIDARRRQRTRDASWSAAPVLTSDGEAIAPATARDAPAGTCVGVAVSSGVVEGRVRVVRDPTRETIAAGEVLVAPFTDPGWTPLFLHAAGLVMEVGGSMSHGSVVARELGIPAVVAVEGATQKLRTGQRVRVDGERGWVTVIDVEAA